MPIFRPRKFTFFPFLILFKRIESIDMTPCVISFLVLTFYRKYCKAIRCYDIELWVKHHFMRKGETNWTISTTKKGQLFFLPYLSISS